jgi:hypothetical protein
MPSLSVFFQCADVLVGGHRCVFFLLGGTIDRVALLILNNSPELGLTCLTDSTIEGHDMNLATMLNLWDCFNGEVVMKKAIVRVYMDTSVCNPGFAKDEIKS